MSWTKEQWVDLTAQDHPSAGGARREKFRVASAKRASTNPNLLKSWGLSASQVVLAPGADLEASTM